MGGEYHQQGGDLVVPYAQWGAGPQGTHPIQIKDLAPTIMCQYPPLVTVNFIKVEKGNLHVPYF